MKSPNHIRSGATIQAKRSAKEILWRAEAYCDRRAHDCGLTNDLEGFDAYAAAAGYIHYVAAKVAQELMAHAVEQPLI